MFIVTRKVYPLRTSAQDGRELTHFYHPYILINYLLLKYILVYVVIMTYDTTWVDM
jgi:hypothetical protein